MTYSGPDPALVAPRPEALRASALPGNDPGYEDLQRRIADVRLVIAGYFKGATNRGQVCDHGRFYYEDCIACYDAAIEAALDGNPQEETLKGRRFDAQGTPTRSAETEGLSPKDGGPVSDS